MRFLVFLVLFGAVSARELIIGGYECKPHSQPWQAFFKTEALRCSGSLINPYWVVSAAHCYSITIEVRLGKHNISVDEGTEQSIVSEFVLPHPQFNMSTLNNDIMLIKLSRPAVLTEYVQPVKLPVVSADVGTMCTVSGWGNTMDPSVDSNKLQCLETPIISDRDCNDSYPDFITDSMFCSGFLEGGKGTCYGDSGGPLVCNGELQGVVSAGGRCAGENKPGIYTKVCLFNAWLKDTMSRYEN